MNCDPLARWYRWLEYASFGRALERRRTEFLSQLSSARRVLMLGEGDGRFLANFLRCNPVAEVDYVDSSRQMLTIAKRGAEQVVGSSASTFPRVHFHHAEVRAWLRAGTVGEYDVICTHFFLDCFATAQLETLVAELRRHATAHARWIVSEFRCSPTGFAAWWSPPLIALLYAFFQLFTGLKVRRLPDHCKALCAAGFRLREQRVATGGLLVSELWERGGVGERSALPTQGFYV